MAPRAAKDEAGSSRSLEAYQAKRDFSRTAEPGPDAADAASPGWRFVVQKHDATRLHYDLRLELGGVLLSWAVTRGPSFVHAERRLAVRTEDHPLKYIEFEGTIPKGQYGAGTMIVWDRGTWTPDHDPREGLAKGHLDFALDGERLHGHWHLVRMKPKPREKGEQWLLLKASDDFERDAGDPDVLEEYVTSVISGRSNDDLACEPEIRPDHAARQTAAARAPRRAPAKASPGARKALLPPFVEPCLASLAPTPPSGAEWLHEIKFDGYRIQARIDGDEVRLLTRKGLDWTDRFGAVATALREVGLGSALLDGEIVVEDSAGISSFNALVGDLSTSRQDRLRYYVFDCLYAEGESLLKARLDDRKARLRTMLDGTGGRVVFSDHVEVHGEAMIEHACKLGLEGIVSKRRDAPYLSGRGEAWVKSKCVERQEFVVVGFVPSTAVKRAVGSLVLGYYEGDALVHAGRAGSGLSAEEALRLFPELDGRRIAAPRFGRKPIAGAEKDVRWVTPDLVAEVEFRGWSKDGVLRQATFQGMREDKVAAEIVREDAHLRPTASRTHHTAGVPARLPSDVHLTHRDRVLWPEQGITKQGLAEFYAAIADFVLPHIAGRPLSMVRCPGGIEAKCFFAKHAWAGLSETVDRVDIGDEEPMLAIHDLDGLMELVQGSSLELHPWGSRVDDLERPDRLVFDLDPGEGIDWPAIIEAAGEVRRRLAADKLTSFVKTSGGKGLHVVVPITPSVDWDTAKAYCKTLVERMAADEPDRYVAVMTKTLRQGRIFLDYLRNGRGATAVAAYSTRARAGAGVSTPLAWDELSPAIRSDHFTVETLPRRLAHLDADPWEGFLTMRQRLPGRRAAKR